MTWKVTATIRDAEGDASSFSFFCADTYTPATLAAFIEPIFVLIDSLIDGVIINVGATQEIDMTGWAVKGAIAGQHDRREGGRFVWLAGNGARSTFTLPTFKQDTYVAANASEINTAHADVSALVTAFIAGDTVTQYGFPLTVLEAAYETFGGKK